MKSIDLKSILSKEDDLGKVIHSQIQIEHLVNDFIAESIDNPIFLKKIGLDYFGKVHLALALGLPSELKAPLTALGKLRNDFAHKLDTKIDSSNINNFYNTFPPKRREDFMKSAKDSNQTWVVENIPWSQVEPSIKFQLLCIYLFYWCSSRVEFKKIERENIKLGRVALRRK